MAATPDAVILDMMTNIHDNGFNPAVSGETDGPQEKPRHDVLTDQRYLHNLLLYKYLHPQAPRFDSHLDRFRKIIHLEFDQSRNERYLQLEMTW